VASPALTQAAERTTSAVGAESANAGDVKALTGTVTRTLVIEEVPQCDDGVATAGDSPTSRNFEVGADAVTLRIEFERGTARLRPDATRRLDQLGATLHDPTLAGARFLIAGHTDSTGSDAVNVPLSCERAKAVRNYMAQRHRVSADRFQVEGFGAVQLLDVQQPTAAANRRVEVRRLFPAKP